jgi:hypothetical protein
VFSFIKRYAVQTFIRLVTLVGLRPVFHE